MEKLIQKVTSRKFLTCVAGIIMGLCVAFGIDEGAVSTIAGAVTAVVSIVSYIAVEGKIDAEAVKDAADKVEDAVDVMDEIEE